VHSAAYQAYHCRRRAVPSPSAAERAEPGTSGLYTLKLFDELIQLGINLTAAWSSLLDTLASIFQFFIAEVLVGGMAVLVPLEEDLVDDARGHGERLPN